jgi:hypothetical protein
MTLRISDPLALLPYQTGLLQPPLDKKKAEGNTASALDSQQRAIELGEPVPIVFGKYIDDPLGPNDYGGVFISPGATKARYQDGISIGATFYPDGLEVTMNFVLSEGELGQIRVEDVYQRACKQGIAYQYYGANAGAFYDPGNFIDYTNIWTCPNYCGTNSGTYADMTTLWYRNTYLAGDDTWNRQVHVFIRNGIRVPRIIEGTTDSSNNLIDLALYLIRETSRVPELLIDTAAMLTAAQFTQVNGFSWDGVIKESSNLEDWMQRMASSFLLRVSDNNGKKGFRPRLPINANYTIKTTAVSWVFGFTEEHILPDGFQIEYIPLSERKPVCAQMIWRQQPPNDIGFIRTTEVRINGQAEDGPFEQFDLSQFCTRENHAVKVGAYQVARRAYVTHSLRIKVKPDSFNGTLQLGDIVRVQLRREISPGDVTMHDYLYEVEKINKTISGVVELDLIHFPIDSQGRSVLALYVAGAVGTGFLYPVGRNDYTCDDPGNAGDDTPLPDNVGENNPDTPDTDVDLPAPGTDDGTGGGLPSDRPVFPAGSTSPTGTTTTTNYPPSGGIDNVDDPFDSPSGPVIGGIPVDRPILPGDTLTVSEVCPGQYNVWYRVNTATGEKEEISRDTAIYIIQSQDMGYSVYVEGRCPDPGSPDGYGTPQDSESVVVPISPNYVAGNYRLLRFEGPFARNSYISGPFTLYKSGRAYQDYATCGGSNGRVWYKDSSQEAPAFGINSCYVSMATSDFLALVFLINPDGSETSLGAVYG